MNLNNVTIISEKPGWTISPIKLAIQRLVNRELEHLRPYTEHHPVFESTHLYEDLGPNWPKPPEVTPEFMRMTMAAAMSA